MNPQFFCLTFKPPPEQITRAMVKTDLHSEVCLAEARAIAGLRLGTRRPPHDSGAVPLHRAEGTGASRAAEAASVPSAWQRLEGGVRGTRRGGIGRGGEGKQSGRPGGVGRILRALPGRRTARRATQCPRRHPLPTRLAAAGGPGRGDVSACSAPLRRLLSKPRHCGPGVSPQVPAPRAVLPEGRPGAALAQELRSPPRQCRRGEAAAGAEGAAEGKQANAGAATSGLRRRAPAAAGASGDIGPQQLKG